MRIRTVSALVLTVLGSAMPARATYSITAVDTQRREVGGAGTTCLNNTEVIMIYASAPGFGALNAQASFNMAGRDEASKLLAEGTTPSDIIASITSPVFDFFASQRQYGVVSLTGEAAGFTGSNTLPYAGDVQGAIGPYAYSAQGNILTSARVLEQAQTAFEGGGCDLADKLMLALEAGAKNGEGDSRCTPDGLPSTTAYIQVDLEGEPSGSYLRISVPDVSPDNPIEKLRAEFDVWRQTHPCPLPTSDLPDGGTSTASPDAGEPERDESADSEVTADASSDGVVDASSAGNVGRSAPQSKSSGCEVRVPPSPSSSAIQIVVGCLIILFFARVRRRREDIRAWQRRPWQRPSDS